MATNYYNEQKKLIGTSIADVILYMQSIQTPDGSNTSAYNMPITLTCNPLGVIQVKSSGVVPKFLYIGGTSPKNKIYPQLLKSDTLALNVLCNGLNATNVLVAPDCGTTICEVISIVAPDCGTVIFMTTYNQVISLFPNVMGGWAVYGDIISSVTPDGVVTLNISVINSAITTHTLFTNEYILFISINGTPTNTINLLSANHPNLPPTSEVIINPAQTINYSGYETSVDTNGTVISINNIQYNINA